MNDDVLYCTVLYYVRMYSTKMMKAEVLYVYSTVHNVLYGKYTVLYTVQRDPKNCSKRNGKIFYFIFFFCKYCTVQWTKSCTVQCTVQCTV